MAYSNTSPWGLTNFNSLGYLDIFEKRNIPANADDYLYKIQPQYTYRPDLLAYDLYGSSKLWWVFIQRNMDTIKDPIWDFVAGTEIYIPQPKLVKTYIGI
jgi:hypothetical protein